MQYFLYQSKDEPSFLSIIRNSQSRGVDQDGRWVASSADTGHPREVGREGAERDVVPGLHRAVSRVF